MISTILYFYGGYVDYFYNKFTTPKQSSMILGDSRSLQGLQPLILNSCLDGSGFELPVFNYSFTIAQAAYGELYTQSILKKLNPETENGLFILTVNPWMLAKRPGENYEENKFFEEGTPPHNMNFVSINPNFEYVIKNFNYFHFRSLIRKTSKLHKDGWLEERNLPKDSLILMEWTKNQEKMYKGFAGEWERSDYRIEHLKKLIEILHDYGRVVLVRMPINEGIYAIEEGFWSNFSKEIKQISKIKNIDFYDFSVFSSLDTYDGNHLNKTGGAIFSKILCDSIFK